MIAQSLHIKTTSGIPGAFALIFKKFGVEVSAPGPVTGAVKLDAAAGGTLIPMAAEASGIRWPGLPAGVHTYEVAVSGLPIVSGHMEVLPGILTPPAEGDHVSVTIDLLAQWRVTVAVGSGKDGDNGANAYELAQQQGYSGTLDQWLASLKGDSPEISGLVPWPTYTAHANNATIHTTAADKARWDAAAAPPPYAVKIIWTNPPASPYYRDDMESVCISCGHEFDWLASTGCDLIVYTATTTLAAPLLNTLESYRQQSPGSSYTRQAVTLFTALRQHLAAGGGNPGTGGSTATVTRHYWRLRWTRFPDGHSSGSMAAEIRQVLNNEGYMYSYLTDDLCDIYAQVGFLSSALMSKLAQYTAPNGNGTYTLERFDMAVDAFAYAHAIRQFGTV